MKLPLALQLIGAALGVVSLILAWSVDWRIAAAILFAIWGNNMERRFGR